VEQQNPSTQKPLVHSLELAQSSAVFFLQLGFDVQVLSPVQVHSPADSGAAQVSQVLSQARLQQNPSIQSREAHSLAAVHAVPSTRSESTSRPTARDVLFASSLS
jgi:hypothetical protein